MSNVLTSGSAQKSAGDSVRLPMDWGDVSQLIDGADVVNGVLVLTTNIASYTVTATGLTVSGVQLDNLYTTSAKFAGGVSGTTYSCVFGIVLDDADATTYSRTGPLKVL